MDILYHVLTGAHCTSLNMTSFSGLHVTYRVPIYISVGHRAEGHNVRF